jgi:hypothetical protein
METSESSTEATEGHHRLNWVRREMKTSDREFISGQFPER